MGNKRRKSGTMLLRNLEETKQRLNEMEAELLAVKAERYNTVGEIFSYVFKDCPDFDIVRMSDGKIRGFLIKLRQYYDYYAAEEASYQYPIPADEIYPDDT